MEALVEVTEEALTEVGAPGTAIPVAGNTAVTVVEAASLLTALFETLEAPATVKTLELIPFKV